MSNQEVDRGLVRRLLVDDGWTQHALAKDMKIDRPRVARRIGVLRRAGIVSLHKHGQEQIPRLTLFAHLETLENAISTLRSSLTDGDKIPL